jgi:hypothetical protein
LHAEIFTSSALYLKPVNHIHMARMHCIGEESIEPDDTSEASIIFTAMAELAQAGTSYENMEEGMAARGFDTNTIVTALSGDADMKDKVVRLMRGVAQQDMVKSLSNRDEAHTIANSKSSDAFGNNAIGRDRERKEPPGRPNHATKPANTGNPHGPFGGPHEGQGNGQGKPTPPQENDQHFSALTTALEGCSVTNPGWVGDGYCDKTEGYNTAECRWDGGDCCDFTCVDMGFTCGYNGYDCKSCSVPNPGWVADGYCDTGDYNTAGCGWDGGDCCAGTCVSTETYTCGQYGYDCSCEPTPIVQASSPYNGDGPGFKIRNGKDCDSTDICTLSNQI